MKSLEITKEYLEEMIYTKGLKQRDIAKIFKCSEACISKKMKYFGITKTPEKRWIGKTYGSLTVVDLYDYDKYGHAILSCICECGSKLNVVCHSLTSKNTQSCGCISRKRGKNHPNYKGYEEIQKSHWNQYLKGAKERNLEFDITIEYAWSIYIKQNRLCALTGDPIFFPKTRKQKSLSTASLDRIDSSRGYIKGNVQWVHKDVNKIKWDLPEDRFFDICKKVAYYRKDN
jgi:hypothetical protein